ncbi:hypothetical protein JCM19000A_13760 [Silvimonas sp. JCM 19000]
MESVSKKECGASVALLQGAIHAGRCRHDAKVDVLGAALRAEIGAVHNRVSTLDQRMASGFEMISTRFDSLEKQFQSSKRMLSLVASLMALWLIATSLGVPWQKADRPAIETPFRQYQQQAAPHPVASGAPDTEISRL